MKKNYNGIKLEVVSLTLSVLTESPTTPTYGVEGFDDFGFDIWV